MLLLLLLSPAARAQIASPTATMAQVYAAALAFMAPRTLEPVGIPQLTVWGLHGLTAIDPDLTAELADGSLRLLQGPRVLFTQAPPAADDAVSWAGVAATICAIGAEASPTVARAGAQAITQSFFDEMFNHLDPYSRYVGPNDAPGDIANRSGTAGIGATLGWRGNAVVLRAVLAGGPAADAGLSPGDAVLGIDGQTVRRRALATMQSWLAGPDGSRLILTVRGPDGAVRDVAVQRATLPPETVFSSRLGPLLALRVTGFAADTADRMATELAGGLRARRGLGRPAGVVIDLRGNRGGLLRQAVSAVGLLLSRGIIATTVGRDPQADHAFEATGVDVTDGLPVAVIVDGRSASAAEIFAAALADQRRAVVVGSATLGKGLVQAIDPLPDGGELFLTWSRVLAPRGWPIQGLGVLPQLCTSLGGARTDAQLRDLDAGRLDMAPALARERAARAPLPPAEILAMRAACPAAVGGDGDVAAARAVLASPVRYATALLPP